MRRLSALILTGALVVTALAACSSGGTSDKTITLVTHDSFAASKPVLRAFTQQTGWKVRVLKNGDAGAALNQVILTKDAPLGDAFYGVDNTFLTRALDEKVFDVYRPQALASVTPSLRLDPSGHATPVDFGDVCVNWDKKRFASTPPPDEHAASAVTTSAVDSTRVSTRRIRRLRGVGRRAGRPRGPGLSRATRRSRCSRRGWWRARAPRR